MGGAWDLGIMFRDFAGFAPKPRNMEEPNQWIHRRRTLYPDTKLKSFVDFGEFDLIFYAVWTYILERSFTWLLD